MGINFRDSLNLAQLAINFAGGGAIPRLGIGSSVGIPNAPVNIYVLTLPYLLSSSPQLATQYIGFLNVLAIFVLYLLARRYIAPVPALLVILALTANPWAVIFSRKIWAQNMLMPFVVATVGTGILGFIDKKKWGQLAHFPLLALTGQIHYGAFVLIPVSVYLLWLNRKHFTPVMLAGIVLMGVVSLPYISGMMEAGYNDLDRIREMLSQNRSTTEPSMQLSTAALQQANLLVSGKELHALAGAEQFLNYLETVPDVYPLFQLLSVAVILSALWLALRSVRFDDRRSPVDITLLIWLILPPLLYTLTWTEFFIHYLIPIFPAAYLILGFAVHDLLLYLQNSQPVRTLVTALLTGMFGAIFVFQVVLWLALLGFVDTQHTPDGFGTPLHYLMEVRQAILDQHPAQVIVAVGGQALIYDDGPTVWNTLLTDVPVVRFTDQQTTVYPAEDALLLTNQCDGQTEVFLLREGEGCLSVAPVRAGDFPAEQFTDLADEVILFANGVSLAGYAWDGTCLDLAWGIAFPADQDYTFAVSFHNASNELISQADGLSWPGRYWRPGDPVVRQFCVSEPFDAIVSVRVGMYVYDGTQFFDVDLLDEASNPAGKTFRLDLN